ncbi:aldo-keto reductase family 1 member B1-like [Sitophilus oryzae]|uniref:Aldo-keto reductase family 1 member B1-like n=1 Tax=Sitophilus oryzae TaxID=7048 RepID=A0A6J2YEY9_SITOR|nr:aldo-keto reductase family 1 member B1-like [Sitophilus oryzae]
MSGRLIKSYAGSSLANIGVALFQGSRIAGKFSSTVLSIENSGRLRSLNILSKRALSNMTNVPTVTLNNGQQCPVIGLGTWLSPPGECEKTVKHALSVGYRHIDCAWLYGNEKEVGDGVRAAIKEGIVKREDLFIVTKLWNTFHEIQDVVPAIKTSLENLGLDYLDLYLVHWPVACKNTGPIDFHLPFKDAVYYDHDFCETWKGMEECVDLGLTKSIGLSNFNSKQVQRIVDKARIKPVMNQIEVNPSLTQKNLIAFCRDRGIHITAYSPLGSPARPWKKPGEASLDLEDPKLVDIGKKYGKTTAQIILKYLIQIGTIPIPKSSNLDRIAANIQIFDFELTPGDMCVLDCYNTNTRICHAEELKESNEYPFRGVAF